MACFRARWPEADVPPYEPVWLYYEVDTAADLVLRTIHVYADGRIERDSVAIEQRKGDHCPTLVDGPFMRFVHEAWLDPIPSSTFGALWERGTDTPFWFPDDFPRSVGL